MKQKVKKQTEANMRCPRCGNQMIAEGGCKRCPYCGYTPCH